MLEKTKKVGMRKNKSNESERVFFLNFVKVHVPCYACHTQALEKKFTSGKHSKWTSTYEKIKKIGRKVAKLSLYLFLILNKNLNAIFVQKRIS